MPHGERRFSDKMGPRNTQIISVGEEVHSSNGSCSYTVDGQKQAVEQ